MKTEVKKNVKTVERVIKENVVETEYILTLSEREAEELMDMFGQIKGNTNIVKNVWNALYNNGVSRNTYCNLGTREPHVKWTNEQNLYLNNC